MLTLCLRSRRAWRRCGASCAASSTTAPSMRSGAFLPARPPHHSRSSRRAWRRRWNSHPAGARATHACRMAKGLADTFLPPLSHALFFFSRHLAQFLADKGYNAAAKNDVRMVEVRRQGSPSRLFNLCQCDDDA